MAGQTDKPKANEPRISNRKARHNYQFLEKVEAGLALVGTEVKSIRAGRISLDEAFGRLVDGEAWLYGAHVSPYEPASRMNHEPTRPRKLLLHRRELKKLARALQTKGVTLVPLTVYFNRGRVKVELAIARGKSYVDKRQDLKARDHARQIERAMRR
jgi:SsrA-binding protein